MTTEPQTAQELISVHSCKYDGRIHRRWRARLSRREGSLLVLDAVFEEEVNHPLLGRILTGTESTEYYWEDRWYSIFRFAEPTGELRNFYCNVNLPARFDGRLLSFIDLDMDVLVAPDFSYQVLDEDEFETNAARFGYPPEVHDCAHEALEELITLVRERRFPFNLDA